MKNDSTFVRMRSGDHLGDAKMSKKGTSLRLLFAMDRNGFRRMKEEGGAVANRLRRRTSV